MTRPEISVVLPAYNAEATIDRALDSILAQTLTSIECLVVDDGSTDGTRDRVRARTDPRLRLLELPHRGVVHAANTGAEEARAPILARMDADDLSHPERLQTQRDTLERDNVDGVGCQVAITDERGAPVASLERYRRWINEETLTPERISALRFVELPLVNPTIMARRSYFELGFEESADPDGAFPEDYDLFLRAIAAGLTFAKVPRTLHTWTDRAGRVTRTDPRYSPDAFDRCRRRHLIAGPLRDVKRVDLWGLGKTGKTWLRWLTGVGREVRHGYDLDPRKEGQVIHGVPVRFPRDLAPADGTPLLIAVGAAGARQIIEPQLRAGGYRLGCDAWFVA